uniref:Uncharacterized protein n=1 Tax=Rhizophora mucronata TaxID=61149 RepID=A0A2P2Q3D1_RHIMU
MAVLGLSSSMMAGGRMTPDAKAITNTCFSLSWLANK